MKKLIPLIGLVALCSGCTTISYQPGGAIEINSYFNKKSIGSLVANLQTNGAVHVKLDKYESNQTDALMRMLDIMDKRLPMPEDAAVTP